MEKLDTLDLHHGDCFDIFPKLEDNSISLFVLDLPYNQTSCSWDKDIINLEEMWKHIKRVIKPSGIVVHFCTAKFGYRLIRSNEKWFRYDLVWKKSKKVGFLSANKMPLRQHENLYVFKNQQGTYNPQKTEGKPYKCKQGKQSNLYGIEGKENVITENTGERHPTSLIDYDGDSILPYNNPHKTIHRTQKPVELVEWLIKTYSNEGETVCDFCMGSGTTAIASLNTNREFVGMEKDPEIYELAEKRIFDHIEKLIV